MINTINIVPRYAETDKMGIVHHSVYAIWYEPVSYTHLDVYKRQI